MEILSGLIILGCSCLVYFLLTYRVESRQSGSFDEETYNRAVFPEENRAPSFTKVVEATERATEMPDGTVVSVRKVRQWQ